MLLRFTKLPVLLQLALVFSLLLLSSCGTKKYLDPGQRLLKKNQVRFESIEKIKDQRGLKYDLSTIYKQKPNEKLFRLFRTRLWFYYQAEKKDRKKNKTSKFRNWIKRVIAEPPSIYDENLADATAQTMQYFLQNKGYYEAEVTFEPFHKRKTTNVVYTVRPKSLYVIDSLRFECKDEKIQRILDDTQANSFLKKGKAVSESVFNDEKKRIVKMLKNLGYAYFDESYIDPTGYTDTSKHLVDVVYTILPSKGNQPHKIYKIGEVNIIPAYRPSEPKVLRDTFIDGIKMQIDSVKPFVKPRVILNAIHIFPGELFKQNNVDRTNNHLANLDIYKFISVKPVIDPLTPDLINYDIKLTPKKKQVFGYDIEINSSNYSDNATGSLLGFGGGISNRNRNLGRSATALGLEMVSNVELDISNKFSIFTFNGQLNADLFSPKYVGVTGFWKTLNTFGLVSDQFFNDLREKAKTRVSANYNYFSTINFYNYHSLNLSRGFDVQLSPSNRVRINTSGINLLLPSFQPAFDTILMNNPFLQRSFDQQLFTGFLFRDIAYTHTGRTNKFGQSWYFGARFELSGAEVLFLNSLYNTLFNKDTRFSIYNLDFEHYASLELEGRRYKTFSDRNQLAYKLKVGIAMPYGKYTDEVPYVKQFPAGGPNGIRAWALRELGPGSFFDPDANENIFFQAGNFNLEFSLEYRFRIIGPFESAIFLDGGNIWSLNKNDVRGNEAVLGSNFLNQIALGTGVGLRIDIKYAILRFDFGLKMRQPFIDPSRGQTSHWLFSKWNNINRDLYSINFAIGYPF